MFLNYEEGSDVLLITLCPNSKKPMVGSVACTECDFFVAINEIAKEIFCNYYYHECADFKLENVKKFFSVCIKKSVK